jgi:predicted TIM-barrel fold metal-dependent hydrolase
VTDLPLIISVDDHVVEPPNLWMDRLPSSYRDIGPRVVRGYQPGSATVNERGLLVQSDSGEGLPTDWWVYEDVHMPIFRSFAGVSYSSREDVDRTGMTYDEMRPGCYDPAARIADLAEAHIEASLCFPNLLPRFCGQSFLWSKDKDLAGLCVTAYNDWVIDEWCAGSQGRLIPLIILPLWDVEAAAKEVYRNAARGARAITFSENPTALGLPSLHAEDRHWDPLWAACEETKTVICVHIGSSSQMPKTAPDAPQAVRSVIVSNNAMTSMADWLFSGNFMRFPGIKVAMSEAEIGWIPYILERIDRVWHTRLNYYDREVVPVPPSQYFHSNMYGCMVSDQHGIDSIDVIGEDNILFEVDYPHADSTWPDTISVAGSELAKLTELQQEKVLRRNAIDLFRLDL